VTDVVVSGLDEPALVGEDHHLDTVAQAELGENARHMRFHRGGSDEELLGDLSVLGNRNSYLPSWLEWLPEVNIEGVATPEVVAEPERQLIPAG
jgi:hypothetical protein